jgi:hypothetical protein
MVKVFYRLPILQMYLGLATICLAAALILEYVSAGAGLPSMLPFVVVHLACYSTTANSQPIFRPAARSPGKQLGMIIPVFVPNLQSGENIFLSMSKFCFIFAA